MSVVVRYRTKCVSKGKRWGWGDVWSLRLKDGERKAGKGQEEALQSSQDAALPWRLSARIRWL